MDDFFEYSNVNCDTKISLNKFIFPSADANALFK